MYTFINVLLTFVTKRLSLIVMTTLTIVFSFYCLKHLLVFISDFSEKMTDQTIGDMSDILNGLAGLLVAYGVLLESREIIQKMTGTKPSDKEHYLNLVAEHNGMGLLLIGLFMELITLTVYLPGKFLNTSGIELYLFIFSIILIIVSIFVEADLIKDYTLTFFRDPDPAKYKKYEQE